MFLKPGQLVVGGTDGNLLSTVEFFPRHSFKGCLIPDLPQPRIGHSLSIMSGSRYGGWLVVCGGWDGTQYLDSCISWVEGNTTWSPLFKMR